MPAPNKRARESSAAAVADVSCSEEDTEEEWEVQDIVAERLVCLKCPSVGTSDTNTLQTEYLVRWVGFSSADDSWEPKQHLSGAPSVVERWRRNSTGPDLAAPAKVVHRHTTENKKEEEEEEAEDEDVYTVSRIVAQRTTKDGTTQYRVRWSGYGPKYDTWEPLASLLPGARSLLQAFQIAEAQKPPRRRTHTVAGGKLKLVEAFATPSEMQRLCDLVKLKSKQFVRSTVVDERNEVQEDVQRTSDNLLLGRFDPAVASLVRRAADMCGVTYAQVEPRVSVVRYKAGQQFFCHHDDGVYDPDQELLIEEPRGSRASRRLFTVLVYLNTVADGGETSFPRLQCKVTAEAGRAVIWRNYVDNAALKQGRPDLDMLHAGCPPQNCLKYAVNIWIHDRPCA